MSAHSIDSSSSIDDNRHSFTPSATHSRSVSPTPKTNNPYRNSMSQTLSIDQDARRLSALNTLEKKSVTVQGAGISSKPSSLKSTDEKKTKTTMFDVPEEVDEVVLQKKIERVEEVMKKDITIKFRIRMAKAGLRCINFGCSLVVLAMVANSFSIFFATRHLPTRNNLPPWAPTSILWPTYATLAIACLSLVTALFVLFSYWKGGHRKAERAAIWFTCISVGGFLFMIILWAVIAASISNARNNSNGKDLWAWSCNNNERKKLFANDIDYDLVCRQMDWTFICSLIEIVVETLSIVLYCAAFWRFAHKSKLRKSMDARDKIRETIYLKKLEEGDMSVYRPEFDGPIDEEHGLNVNCVDGGIAGIKGEFKKQRASFYPDVPVPAYVGVQPGTQHIIDPNSGLAIDPVTGAASKPTYY